MTKRINILLVVLMSLMLVSCQVKQIIDDEDLNEDLPYAEYFSDDNPIITIKVKDIGTMKAQLFPVVAENTVNNFISYIENKDFNNSSFHRIIKGFMIQGGMVSGSNQPIKGEFNSNGIANPLSHYRGVLSMARTYLPNSATSQFFVMHKLSPHLNGEYAAFGGLISGFDVLDKIANVKTNSGDAPIDNVIIEAIKIELNGYKPKAVEYFN